MAKVDRGPRVCAPVRWLTRGERRVVGPFSRALMGLVSGFSSPKTRKFSIRMLHPMAETVENIGPCHLTSSWTDL